jgi:hypothetical protein
MSLKLVYKGVYYEQNTKINLDMDASIGIPGKTFNKGKIYYELTYYGSSYYFMTGFAANGYISFTPWNSLAKPRIYSVGAFGGGIWIPIPLGLSSIDTVGIGMDIANSQFHIVSQTSSYIHTFPKQQSGTNFSFTTHCVTTGGCRETVSINLGAAPFKYSIPGFIKLDSDMDSDIKFTLNRFSRIKLIDITFILIMIK